VILFALLLFSGIGAGISSRFPLPLLVPLLAGGIAVVAGFLLDQVFAQFLHASLAVRIGVAVAALAPIGICLGLPFPVGIRALAKNAPGLVPWAWGVNGYTSVLGSVLAIFLGISLGFWVVLLLAAGCYGVGLVGLWLLGRPALQNE
jgi:hypothetical protein